MSIEMQIEQVSPDLAATWLANQRQNRAVRKQQVHQWASDMKNGEFPAIPQPIMFDEEGILIDGQHRLTAVLESGVTLQMFVARNVPTEHRRYIDGGMRRTAADVLKMEHGLSSPTTATAIASTVLMYQKHKDVIWGNATRSSKQEVIDEILANFDQYSEATSTGRAATRTTQARLWLTRTAYGGLSVLIERYSLFSEEWNAFTEGVATGADLTKGDPRLTLRSSPVAAGIGGTTRQQYSLLACIKTWNAYVRGESLHSLRVASPKNLPMPNVE